MKKIFQSSLAALAGLVLASCSGDYDDWSNPQGYSQEDAAAAYGVTVTPGTVTMPVENDDVTLLTFTASSDQVSGYAIRSLTIGEVPVDNYTVEGNELKVSASGLEDLACTLANSRAKQTHSLDVVVNYGAVLQNGDAVAGKGSATASITTSATPAIDAKGYFLLGDLAENGGGWDLTSPVWMTDNGDGTYSAVINTKNDGDNWYKFYEGSHYSDSSWDEVNLGQMGCLTNGCSDAEGFIIWTGDKYKVETPVISGKGQFKVTIDMKNMTYSVVRQAVNYYIVGGPNDWAASAKEKTVKFNQADENVPTYTVIFPAAETGDTWFAIGDDKACDAIANDNDWSQLYGTTNGNGESGESGTLARRTELADDGSFKVAEGAKFIKVVIDMNAMTYQVSALSFPEYIYEAGNDNNWGDVEKPLYSANMDGIYTGFFEVRKLDWGIGFKFRENKGDWNGNQWGAGTWSDTGGTLVEGGGAQNLEATPGFYRADVDIANLTYTLTRINTIFVVGSAVNNDWDTGVEMTYNADELCWECTTTLTEGVIKFKGNGTWDNIDGNWGGTLDNVINGSNDNIPVTTTGTVKIKFYPLCDTKSYATITPAN